MMRYDKEQKKLLIRINESFPEDLLCQYREAILDLLDKLDENYTLDRDLQRPLLMLVRAMSPSFGQWCAITGKRAKDNETPTTMIFDGGFYVLMACDDPEMGANLIRSILFYLSGSLELSERTKYYTLDLLGKLLPSNDQLNEIYNK